MKVTTSDLLAILKRFNIASDEHVPRNIDQVRQSHPSEINQLVRFRFDKRYYSVLFDETAEDNRHYIIDQLRTTGDSTAGELLENPTSDITTFGLPFKGRDAYLFSHDNEKTRLDVLLAERYPETSRATWQKHIRAGSVSVNNQPTTSPKYAVSEADAIAINIPEATDYSEHSLPIVYLDDDVIVINKPAGILTHSKGELNDEFTVADFFRRYTNVGLDTNRPGIVHRLDRDTSGLVIGARTPEAFELLKSQFANRKAGKYYLAAVTGQPKQPSATIDIPIGRNPSQPSSFRADSRGKSAVTEYETIAVNSNKTLLKLHPLTGRTHQLRVHMAYIGTPIIGDRVYGKAGERLMLHAYKLEITTHPNTRQVFTAEIPVEFKDMFSEKSLDVVDL